MRKFAAAALLLATASAIAAAQETRNELSGTIGRTFISDQTPPNTNFFDNTVHSGKGLSFEVNYARELRNYRWGALALEVPAIYNPDEDINYGLNVVPKDYSSFFITPAARVTFLQDLAFSPWVSFGGGVGHFQASKDLIVIGTNTGHRVKTTGVVQGGVGLDVRIPWRFHNFKFRVEARDNYSGVPPINVDTGKTRQHNYYVGGGIVYQF
jgi:hypothetical protein